MARDFNHALANAILDRIYDTEFGTGSKLQIRTGAPAGAENAAGGTLLWEYTLVAGDFAAAAAGSKAKAQTWSAVIATSGDAGHFRFVNGAGTRIEEGTITATGGGGDLTMPSIALVSGNTYEQQSFTRTLA